MTIFNPRRRDLFTASAFVLVAGAIPGRLAAESAAVAPIQTLIDSLLEIMKDGPTTPFQKRYEVLAPVIDRTFALDTILQESVGPTWINLPPDQQNMLAEAFRRYTVVSYVNSFDDYNGQRFTISPETRPVGAEQVVETKVIPKKGDSHEIDYVMRQEAGGWRVVDVLADGSISRVAVQRSDFRRLLTRGGAQALAQSLSTKSADLSDGSS